MDHSSGLVFRRPQAASHRRAVVYFCSAVLKRNPDFYAVLGPDEEVDPAPGISPLSLARMKTSGTIVKGKSTGKPRKSGDKLSLYDLALEDEEDEDSDDA